MTFRNFAPSKQINMKKALILGALLFGTLPHTMAQTKTVNLRIVETSDVHGYFFPYDFVNRKPLEGTLMRINTYVNNLRNQYGENLLLIDNGDILQGQPTCYWSNYVMATDQNIAARMVNYMGYDAETIGNHDVEPGHAVYDKWIREVRCPILGANVVEKENGQPYLKPYALFVRDGVKIAVIGLLTPTIPCWLNESVYEGLEFHEMVSCAKKWVKQVREVEHADLVIGLFHSGKEGGLVLNGAEEDATARVAREVPGFDIIFFGHDHQVHNEWIENTDGKQVLTLDPSCFAVNVADAQVSLTYEKGKLRKKDIKGDIVSVRKEQIDEQMSQYFQPDFNRIKSYVDRKIGHFETTVSTRDCFFGNSAFSDFIHSLQLSISGAEESYDRWVNTMKRPEDHLLLLNDASKEDQQRTGFLNYTFNFDSASGIDYEVDVTKPNGQKVRILRMSNGEPFQMNKTYKVVMNSYRGNGGGDLLTKGAGIPKEEINSRIIYQSPLDLRHYLTQEIERLGNVNPQAAHNWKFTPEEWTIPAAKRDYKQLFGEEKQ